MAPSAEEELVPATTLPAALLDDIAHRLVHAPVLRLPLDRVTAALRARECKLAITLEQPRVQGTRLLAEVFGKLGICTAVEACKLNGLEDPSLARRMPLDCSHSLAQCLLESVPALTSLALHGYSISCSGLAALLAHPQLSSQLQQLDLSSTTITQAERQQGCVVRGPDKFTVQPLAQLQVLVISSLSHLGCLPKLLQAASSAHPAAALRSSQGAGGAKHSAGSHPAYQHPAELTEGAGQLMHRCALQLAAAGARKP
ncbi:hypothetical protein V8C86DRAFT_3084361 [Haematococcus lacustris]